MINMTVGSDGSLSLFTPMPELPSSIPSPAAHPESVNGRLANSLDAQREEIMEEWLKRVGKDSLIPTW
jgi:hypothetical protein